jgi:hypothetical protein
MAKRALVDIARGGPTMKKTLVRLKVRREVIRSLTDRDLTTAAGGANSPNPNETKVAGGCAGGAALVKPGNT